MIRCFAVLLPLLLVALAPRSANAQDSEAAGVSFVPQPAAFALVRDGRPAAVAADPGDDAGVLRAARALQADLGRVAGTAGRLILAGAMPADAPMPVIVGTLGRSGLVDRLVRAGRLEVTGVAGEWEAYVQQVVDRPFSGVERALVIAGADRRGTIFGIYDLSRRIGVSPWYWWADVPVVRRDDVYVRAGRRIERPSVRYRGIFINDEEPALGEWARMTFGGFNARFYERVCELILRSRGNFLWPAMWGKSLWEDDPESARLADEMGVVLGTSHHEPMMRAHVDWQRHGEGPWDYERNAERLRAFWRGGLERSRGNEQLVTIGMRGDGDEPMTAGTATDLLERIVRDQRAIIAEVSGRPAAETPQVWALYKEVQDYYDAGMRVPDDVTLLFADDNWGNIRRLPEPGAARPGGYGVYYHFDYVGGPRSYKWLNTNQIERVWEQMMRAYAHGADRLWIVNVGDIKPMEFPTGFFLDLAWDADDWPVERLTDYPQRWAAEQFGEARAEEIGDLLRTYGRYAAWRKPELVDADTYSLVNFNEGDRVLARWQYLQARAEAVSASLPAAYRDAFYELVLHPIEANANLHALYVVTARNRLHAAQGRADTNALADTAERLFARDAEIRRRYEEETAGGRWRHMMAQTHIGYTGWQQPERDAQPALVRINVPAPAALGVAVEGDERAWPGAEGAPRLPLLDPFGLGERDIQVFNRGQGALSFTARASAPWILLYPSWTELSESEVVSVAVDWDRAPPGRSSGSVTLAGSDGTEVTVAMEVFNPPDRDRITGLVETAGIVAIEAADHDGIEGGWREIPHLGLTRSGMTRWPLAGPAVMPGDGAPRLDYRIHLFEGGELDLHVMLSPTLDYRARGGLRYAVAIDAEPPQIVNVHAGTTEADWSRAVADNRWVRTTRHRIAAPGGHTVRLWAIDPGLVFQRLVLARGPLPYSYLGPLASEREGAAGQGTPNVQPSVRASSVVSVPGAQ